MAGVEILAVEEVATKFTFNWNPFWIVACVVFGILVGIGAIAGVSDGSWKEFFIFVLIGVVVGAAFGCITGAGMKTPIEYETQYKVVLDIEVSMVEFMEKYEVIDQNGKIYTVREIE